MFMCAQCSPSESMVARSWYQGEYWVSKLAIYSQCPPPFTPFTHLEWMKCLQNPGLYSMDQVMSWWRTLQRTDVMNQSNPSTFPIGQPAQEGSPLYVPEPPRDRIRSPPTLQDTDETLSSDVRVHCPRWLMQASWILPPWEGGTQSQEDYHLFALAVNEHYW